jgi:hypothetical protein
MERLQLRSRIVIEVMVGVGMEESTTRKDDLMGFVIIRAKPEKVLLCVS